MKIIVNGNEIRENFSGSTLNDILGQIEKNLVLPGTFISSLTVDGEDVLLDDESKEGREALSRDVTEIQTVELVVQSIQSVVIKNLENVEEYLKKFLPGVQKAAELFQKENELEANQFFLNVIDGMGWLAEVLEGSVRALGLNPDKVEFNGRTVLERQSLLIKLTNQLMKANQNKDWVLVADLLEYEIHPFYEEWLQFIPELKKKILEIPN